MIEEYSRAFCQVYGVFSGALEELRSSLSPRGPREVEHGENMGALGRAQRWKNAGHQGATIWCSAAGGWGSCGLLEGPLLLQSFKESYQSQALRTKIQTEVR